MKIVALEEAFAMDGLQMARAGSTVVPVDGAILAEWEKRLRDFTQWRLPEMDKHGISVQVLSLTVPGIQGILDADIAVADAKTANDYLAGVVAKHPDRFRGFAALPLQNPEAAAQELRRCVRELKFCGALINDHTHGQYLDEPQFSPVWQALEELDVPLYIHPGAPPVDSWNPVGRSNSPRYGHLELPHLTAGKAAELRPVKQDVYFRSLQPRRGWGVERLETTAAKHCIYVT